MKELMDKWSLVHFAFWFAAAPGLILILKSNILRCIAVVSGIILWEVFEWYLERIGFIENAEGFWDRVVSDPIVGLAGALLGMYIIE